MISGWKQNKPHAFGTGFQIVVALVAIGVIAAAPGKADTVLLVPIKLHASLGDAFDLLAASDARALARGPITATLVATNTRQLREQALSRGFAVISWRSSACVGRS